MLLEMHSHTREHSTCSSVPAVELVERVFAKGLQGIVLTDHHYLWSEQELAELRRASGVPEHFLILSGQEVATKEFGDVLVYGAGETYGKGTSLERIRREFPEAALIWAHPYRNGRQPEDERLAAPSLDGVEIFNSNQSVRENSRGLSDWHHLRFTAIAGTDTHGESYAGLYPTYFDHPVSTVTELAGEIRAGRCRPFLKEIPKAGAGSFVTEVTIGAKGTDEVRERIIIRTLDSPQKWESAERAQAIMEAVAKAGFAEGPYRVPRPIDEDAEHMTLIQQGLRGKTLFEKILGASDGDGRRYLELAARWLARLHRRRLRITPLGEFMAREEERLAGYLGRFEEIGHRHSGRVRELMEAIEEEELAIAAGGKTEFVQGHGDFHPKNIIIGQDQQENRNTLFVAAIDFERSFCVPPAFDVGCFLAQYRNQFDPHRKVLEKVPEMIFLESYLDAARIAGTDFGRQVEVFRARTNLCIAAFLIKVGKGDSGDLWRVLLEAEQALSQSPGARATAPRGRRRKKVGKCRKGKSEAEAQPGAYRCRNCGAVSMKKNHLCKPKRIKSEEAEEKEAGGGSD